MPDDLQMLETYPIEYSIASTQNSRQHTCTTSRGTFWLVNFAIRFIPSPEPFIQTNLPPDAEGNLADLTGTRNANFRSLNHLSITAVWYGMRARRKVGLGAYAPLSAAATLLLLPTSYVPSYSDPEFHAQRAHKTQ